MLLTFTDHRLGEGEISALRMVLVRKGISLKKLGDNLGVTEGRASQIVKSLEKKGLITSSRKVMTKMIWVADSEFARSLADLLAVESSVPWEKLLSNSGLPFLLGTISDERAFLAGLNRSTIWRTKRNFLMHGISIKQSGENVERDERLYRFVLEYANHIGNEFILANIPDGSVILWKSVSECMFRIGYEHAGEVEAQSENSHLTAVSAFQDYGIPLISQDLYYFFSPAVTTITPEEIVLHTLLIDPNNRTNTAYALLFILKHFRGSSLNQLSKQSKKYGLELRVDEIAKYVRSSGRTQSGGLPNWNRIMELASLYGVDIE